MSKVISGMSMSLDLCEGDGGWGDGGPAGKVPCFVLTHRPPDPKDVVAPDVFTFVTDGVEELIAQAKAPPTASTSACTARPSRSRRWPLGFWTGSTSCSSHSCSARASGCSTMSAGPSS